MNTIPLELWTEVFAFSCTDDGSTGRALSTVSRAVHLTSKPVKYQSLCVVGLPQLLQLLAILSNLSPGERKIKYLFIACLDDSERTEGPPDARHPRDVSERALCQLLNLVSSSLVALHIHRTESLRPSILLPVDISLPALTELTLHGPFQSLQPPCPPPHEVLPSLRRLHICHCSFYPAKFLQHIVHAAPQLKHLRVPQSSFPPFDIQVALGMLRPALSAPDPVYLPSSLEKLVIEVDPASSSPDSWGANIRATQFQKKFQKISDSDRRVCLVDGKKDWLPVRQAKQEWLHVH
ncbi:hypothetical protein DFH06DRAFT_1224558 [Mycena polygramma]|nr:hypothetical protein DFH06DRAFT_1224558 [Mycena polygramma]